MVQKSPGEMAKAEKGGAGEAPEAAGGASLWSDPPSPATTAGPFPPFAVHVISPAAGPELLR